MAGQLGFPTNPSTGTTYTIGSNTWIWTGAAWISYTSSTSSNVIVTTATSSISTVTGSLVITGGLGASGGVNIAGTATIDNAKILTTSTISLKIATDGGNSTNDLVLFTNNTEATSTASGAVTIVGGLGVGKTVFANTLEIPNTILTANTVSCTTNLSITIDSYSTSTFRSAKYVVQIDDPPNYQALEILTLYTGGSSALATEYGKIFNSYDLGAWTVTVTSDNVNLNFQANTATNKVITFFRTGLTL
jgi:hypothetical protein